MTRTRISLEPKVNDNTNIIICCKPRSNKNTKIFKAADCYTISLFVCASKSLKLQIVTLSFSSLNHVEWSSIFSGKCCAPPSSSGSSLFNGKTMCPSLCLSAFVDGRKLLLKLAVVCSIVEVSQHHILTYITKMCLECHMDTPKYIQH